MYPAIEVKANASKLRHVLAKRGHELKHSHCLEVISKIEGFTDWNTHTTKLNKNQQRAELFLDEMLEAEVELSHAKFTQRFEEKYSAHFTESEFLRDTSDIREDYRNYLRREFMGCVAPSQRSGDNRHPNLVRYVWLGFFEKSEVLITVGIYNRNDHYYVCEARYQ